MFSFVQMRRSRFGDYLGGKAALFYFFREAELLPHKLVKWLSCSQGSRGRKGPSGDRFHIVFPYVFLLVTRKGTLEEEACVLSSQELTDVLLRIQMQSWSVRVLMESPRFPPCLPSLPSSCPGRELEAALLTWASFPVFWLLLSSFSGTLSSKFSTYSQYLYCFPSYFCHLSSHYAFCFLLFSHPSLPPPQKRRIKETTVNQTCARAMLSDKFYFIWAPPLNIWKGMLF